MRTIYSSTSTLPRGPHRFPRAHVLASQRGRLLDAMASNVAEVGYQATTVADVASRAGVSLRSFYEHFAGKQECFLAAYDVGVEVLLVETGAVFDPALPWRESAAAVVERFLEVLGAEPAFARTFLLEINAAGRAGQERRVGVLDRFADFHIGLGQSAREQEPSLGELTAPLRVALVAGISELVTRRVLDGRIAELPDMADEIVNLIVAIYEGAPA